MSERLSREALDRLEELEREATAGGWDYDCYGEDPDGIEPSGYGLWIGENYRRIFGPDPQYFLEEDAAFIVFVRNNAPALIAAARRVEELEHRLEQKEQIIESQEVLLKHWELNQKVNEGSMAAAEMEAELAPLYAKLAGEES